MQSAVSSYLVTQLYENVDVAGALGQRLPPSLQGLAGPLAGALGQPTTDTVKLLLGRPRGQQLFVAASTAAHQKFVNVVENKTVPGTSTGNGDVTLDLSELLKEFGAELGLPAGVLARVPPNTGVITVMKSDQLSNVQTGVRAARVLSVWLLVLVLVMFGVAVYLARGIRRERLRNIGWSFVIVGLLVLIFRRVAGNYAIDSLTSPMYRPSARDVFLIGSSILGQVGKATVFYGLVAIVGTVLAGPTRYAKAVRRAIAPTLNEHQGMAWFATAFVFLVLVLWGHDPRSTNGLGRAPSWSTSRTRALGIQARDAPRVSCGFAERPDSGVLTKPSLAATPVSASRVLAQSASSGLGDVVRDRYSDPRSSQAGRAEATLRMLEVTRPSYDRCRMGAEASRLGRVPYPLCSVCDSWCGQLSLAHFRGLLCPWPRSGRCRRWSVRRSFPPRSGIPDAPSRSRSCAC